MSVVFCGTPYLLKRIICKVCGVLWDSIFTKKIHLQCLWSSVGLQYTKKKNLQCLWGSVVVLIIIFQCLWDFCGTPYLLKRYICNVRGVLWDSQYTNKKDLQCLWGFVGLSIVKRNIFHFCGVLWGSVG